MLSILENPFINLTMYRNAHRSLFTVLSRVSISKKNLNAREAHSVALNLKEVLAGAIEAQQISKPITRISSDWPTLPDPKINPEEATTFLFPGLGKNMPVF